MNKRNLIRNGKWVDNEMNGEGNTVPFLEETLAEEKEQPMMCQYFFNIWLSLHVSRSFFVYTCYGRTRMSI